jgi:hypothetical protein
VEKTELLLTNTIPHKTTIHTDYVTNSAGAFGGTVLKMLQTIIKLWHVN